MDETTWGFGGYCGDAGGRLRDKKVSKGGQTTMLYDIHCRYPRAYIHRHKVHKCPEGFSAQGPSEVYELLRSIDVLVVNGDLLDRGVVLIPKPTGIGITQYQLKIIYPKPPHIVADNHFSGDEVMKLFGKKGYSCTMSICIMAKCLMAVPKLRLCVMQCQSLQSNSVLLASNQRLSRRLWFPFSQRVQRIFVV